MKRMYFKAKKDHSLVTNYRLIALLCTDFKILTSILADRLQPILGKFFPRYQTGFIAGRSIYESIFKVSSWTSVKGSVTCLLDFEKAYDRISHPWLIDCLVKANLSSIFT